jgi:hypothetical protein
MNATIDKLAACVAESDVLDYPQPLAVVPTRRFWAHETVAEQTTKAVVIGAVLVMLLPVFVDFGLPWYAMAAIPVIVLTPMFGLFERYIRRRARAIRAAAR